MPLNTTVLWHLPLTQDSVSEQRSKVILKSIVPGKMVPCQNLTQSLFAALASGRGRSSPRRGRPQHHAGCRLRTGQLWLPVSGRPRAEVPEQAGPAGRWLCARLPRPRRSRWMALGTLQRTLSQRPARSVCCRLRAHGTAQAPAPAPGQTSVPLSRETRLKIRSCTSKRQR